METEELPTLNSQLDLMAKLDEKARGRIARLEEELEDTRHACDNLEKQLEEAQKREMENSLRVAGESRTAKEELQRLRFELDNHMLGTSEKDRSVSALEGEKMSLEQRVIQAESERQELVERVSTLEKSLKEAAATKEELEMELTIRQETLDREVQDHEEAQTEYR